MKEIEKLLAQWYIFFFPVNSDVWVYGSVWIWKRPRQISLCLFVEWVCMFVSDAFFYSFFFVLCVFSFDVCRKRERDRERGALHSVCLCRNCNQDLRLFSIIAVVPHFFIIINVLFSSQCLSYSFSKKKKTKIK